MIEERRGFLRALAGILAPLAIGAGLPGVGLVGIGGVSPADAKVRHTRVAPPVGHARVRREVGHARVPHVSERKLSDPAARQAKPVIVIDPGHGGADPGTVGRAGTLEKTVTLDTALQLARVLAATGRYEVLLTRHDDRFVSLSERATFGRAHGAALVISLHADASPDRSARGTSVYVRSNGSAGGGLKPTTTGRFAEMAQALGKAPPPEPGSAWLQYSMIDRLDDEMEMTAAPARAAHLWVLADRDIPGVLVEMGFLSNRQDEKLMRDPRHRLLIARLIRDAVEGYFKSTTQERGLRT
jgi:N-acetylmuramoyl-L-alanine amidase